ncbi:isoprenylcysteine carboxylmethyltransferase family protein [Brevundimonas sp. Root1423]|uniref:methyltransferase family protein n=1 Tax=Brevundimonas sp. Root1423 TaxID=1736462 RepID=UPI0006FF9B69|nr:isoprenylcysteine carboxylmethyltransferase family protein [Brevundimonas sp. Root1423]KQY80504.1 isoprenylcysteine carboxyl methyltransferase [Brevundimonas sp. Root1423]
MKKPDTPGVLAPPPVIYLGFLFLGWGLAELGARPEAVEAGLDWLSAGFGLEMEVRRGVALALIVGGLLLDGMAAGLFRRRGTAVEPWKPSTALISEGPYRFSRNPIYLGFAVTYVGLAIAMNSWIALILLVPCLFVIDRFVIRREERYLSLKFGAAYDAYRQKVRRWL